MNFILILIFMSPINNFFMIHILDLDFSLFQLMISEHTMNLLSHKYGRTRTPTYICGEKIVSLNN